MDHRRKNRSEEAFQRNVQLLKKYKANLILFPRKKNKSKAGDASADDLKNVEQQHARQVVERKAFRAPKASAVEQAKTPSFVLLRRARADAKLVGRRKKRAERAAEAAKNEAAKAAK